MVRVPEALKRLLADLTVGSSIHQEHAEEHYVASDSTSFSVVYLNCRNRTKHISLNIEEAVAPISR